MLARRRLALLCVAGAGAASSPRAPDDWQRKVDAADALFSPGDDSDLPWRSQPGVANGVLGGTLSGGRLYMAGVFSGSTRASVPTELLSVRLGGGGTNACSMSTCAPSAAAHNRSHDRLEQVGSLLDLREATFTRRYTGSCDGAGGGAYRVEQRWYAHRALPSLFVMELSASVPCGCQRERNLRLAVLRDRPNISENIGDWGVHTVHFSNVSRSSGANVSLGTTAQPEGGTLPGKGAVVAVATVATTVPAVIEFPQGCGNFSRRFLHVVRSNLNESIDVRSTALADYTSAMALGPDELHRTHVAAWAELWRSGLEVSGRHELAAVVNSSLYTVLSSLRADWPYGCAPTGLSVNGWAGLAFCKRLSAETHSLHLPACTAVSLIQAAMEQGTARCGRSRACCCSTLPSPLRCAASAPTACHKP